MGFRVPNKYTIDHSFHVFTAATCQCNRTIIRRICWILSISISIEMIIAFRLSEEKSPGIQILLKIFKSNKRDDFGECF